MIVAAGAADCEPQKRAAGGADQIVKVIVAIVRILLLPEQDAWRDAVEAGSNQAVISHLVELVARELLQNELRVRLVGVERLNHVVAIAPGVGIVVIVDMTPAVGVPGNIQPVAPPTLSIMRRGQQSIDQTFERVWRRILDESLDLFGAGQQADQVQVSAADQGVAVGRGSGRQAFLVQRLLDEGVDRMGAPGHISQLGNRTPDRFLEGPPGPGRDGSGVDLRGRSLPFGPALDPAFQIRDFALAELAAEGHLRPILPGHSAVHQAARRIPRGQRGTSLASLQRFLTRGEVQRPHLQR